MKEKELFIQALSTLFQSWGGPTPPEVHWGGNKLLDWYEQEYNIALGIRFDEENDNYDEVVETTKSTISKPIDMKIYSIDPATQARLGQYHCFIVVANSKEEAISLIKTEGQKWLLENTQEEGIYTGTETEPFIMSSNFFGS